ncbi:CPBP family intramembrane metalloprotease [Staphylococcus chromogenes]|nr:CPBP family intramembrane metalloprotease [Staphylococcus chromogenes]
MPQFHLVANPRAWWRPIAELFALALFFFVGFLALMLAIDSLAGEMSDEVGGTIAFLAFVPALWVAVKGCGHRPFSQLISAEGRWSFAQHNIALPIVGGVSVASIVLGTAVLGPHWSVESLPFALFFLLMTPVMAFAEELLFRGWFPQFLGTWIRSGLVCFLLPVPLFAWIHQPSSALGWVGYLVSGTCYALLAWRAQSLVASSVLHAMSNVTLFILNALTGYQLQEAEPMLVAKTIVLAITAALIYWRLSPRARR